MVKKITLALLFAVVVTTAQKVEKMEVMDEEELEEKKRVHFEQEALLESRKDAMEFKQLEENEAKYRLGLLAQRMDRNDDGFVDKAELTDWIKLSFDLMERQKAFEKFEGHDKNNDGKLTWQECLVGQHNVTEDQLKEIRSKKDKEDKQLMESVDDETKKWRAADVNKDGFLDKNEFASFENPNSDFHKHMYKYSLDEALLDYDKDNDGFISVKEFPDVQFLAGLFNAKVKAEDEAEVENEDFNSFDMNSDGKLGATEIINWIISDRLEDVEEEVEKLLLEAGGEDKGKLSHQQIVDNVDIFTESLATGENAKFLHFIKTSDELKASDKLSPSDKLRDSDKLRASDEL